MEALDSFWCLRRHFVYFYCLEMAWTSLPQPLATVDTLRNVQIALPRPIKKWSKFHTELSNFSIFPYPHYLPSLLGPAFTLTSPPLHFFGKMIKYTGNHTTTTTGGELNFIRSSNLLKSKIPICVCVCMCVGGGGGNAHYHNPINNYQIFTYSIFI